MIAIVGMACRYADADSPRELWENVLSQRQAFRPVPEERLRLVDYLETRDVSDSLYCRKAAVLSGWEFDWAHYRVGPGTYRSADPAHWLALQVAEEALADAGFDKASVPRASTGVLIGNTLTGDGSRAQSLRLRWPYVRRAAAAVLEGRDWEGERRDEFLEALEDTFKSSFAPFNEESLAGGLSNTIAGRVCNQLDLGGGGYTVDGACASSLLAVANACSALTAGDLDLAIAGGVDLSLDPFELVGFSRVGALAEEEMRVYDERSSGFLPGEGCGLVVLMRREEALAAGRPIYATIRGWGISSDGSGGITRPERDGHLRAIGRAYDQAEIGVDSVGYFEGHGTGTPVGDATELEAISQARRAASPSAPPAVIGSVKANIGHTKAAAGVAGLIKAALAVHEGVLPPNTGCDRPHRLFAQSDPALRALRVGSAWRGEEPRRAGVSALGFGGINAHLVVESGGVEARGALSGRETALLATPQDAEIFLLSAASSAALIENAQELIQATEWLSLAELSDLAARMTTASPEGSWRAGVVARRPADLARALHRAIEHLEEDSRGPHFEPGLSLACSETAPTIGLLFPGQASLPNLRGGAWSRRFAEIEDLFTGEHFPLDGDVRQTEVAQPALAASSLAGLRLLAKLGLEASIAVGHSLGEIAALQWAGVLTEASMLRVVRARGRAMARPGGPTGAMVALRAGSKVAEELIGDLDLVVAGLNSPGQTVVSGDEEAAERFIERSSRRGLAATRLPVTRAFHSPAVAGARQPLLDALEREERSPLRRTVVSTVTGETLPSTTDVRELLARQLTSPVRFVDALEAAEREGVDLWIEVGAGTVASELARESSTTPAFSLDVGGSSLASPLEALAAAWVLGAWWDPERLFADRVVKPIDAARRPAFLTSPCEELAPADGGRSVGSMPSRAVEPEPDLAALASREGGELDPEVGTLDVVRELVARSAELPVEHITPELGLLSDLHLSSIKVSQLVAEASQRVGLEYGGGPSDFANATVGDLAVALDQQPLLGTASSVERDPWPDGVDAWVRPFRTEYVECALSAPARDRRADEGDWELFSAPDHPLERAVGGDFWTRLGGSGVALLLPSDPDEEHLALMLDAARAATARPGCVFLVVQQGGGGSGLAKTVYLEGGDCTVCVVDLPFVHPRAGEWIRAEARAAKGFVEVRYDERGARSEPVVRSLPLSEEEPARSALDGGDVLLVSGGGKGIGCESAVEIARRYGLSLLILGRSEPSRDPELRANLDRLTRLGIRHLYRAADVTELDEVRAAVRSGEAELGPVTAILHAAGLNDPRRLESLDEELFRRTVAAKQRGLRNLMAAVAPSRLRLLLAFGSVIARTGMAGEAHYAVANEWLRRAVSETAADLPRCRCLTVEWSVWSGAGMGERLGRVDALRQQGIASIAPEAGTALLISLLEDSSAETSVVATGRLGDLSTLRMEPFEPPLRRFLEKPRVFYPGVELVADAELSQRSDPYLADHVFEGRALLPAVMGLEAMAQAAMAVALSDRPPVFENVRFEHPVSLPDDEPLGLRVAALARSTSRVDVVLRSSETAYKVDHYSATCRFRPTSRSSPAAVGHNLGALRGLGFEAEELYGSLLFQSGRFQRLARYRDLRATECLAEISSDGAAVWFDRLLPRNLVLGDPGARDAVLHSVQACIPQSVVLPAAVGRVTCGRLSPGEAWSVAAEERSRRGDTLVYDLEILDSDGEVRERWEELELRIVAPRGAFESWEPQLLGPYLERQLGDLFGGAGVSVSVVHRNGLGRRKASDLAIGQATSGRGTVWRRGDGRPEVVVDDRGEAPRVSAAHASGIVLAVAAEATVACDMEAVLDREPEEWRRLLGPKSFELGRRIDLAVEPAGSGPTRVWTALECLKKAGLGADAPLVADTAPQTGWIVLRSGDLAVSTYCASVRGVDNPLIFSVLTSTTVPGSSQDKEAACKTDVL